MSLTKSFLLLAGWLLGLSLAAQHITAAEYFWDTDPGAGNGTPIPAVDGNFNDALEAILLETATLPAVGQHTLGIRARDLNNAWGPVFRKVIVVEPSLLSLPEIRISQAEYFWDNDPGPGNGLPMLAFDGDFNSALEQVMVETAALPPVGAHVLGMRARDAQGGWGPVFRVVVDVLPNAVSFPSIRVSLAEYFVNDDPGPGQAMPMLAVDGDFSSALERIRGGEIPTPVYSGVNVLWMRARDALDQWGPVFGIVVNIDTTIVGTVSIPEPEPPAREVILLPNPTDAASGFIIRFSDAPGDVRVMLLDAGGKRVAEHHFLADNEVRVPLNGMVRGLYHVGIWFREGLPEWRRLVVH
ncbi:MAG: hypothetical protein KIT10_02645 [Flavobacteriales bacterium]|nr:hypothetical protein [Flavobacteriales bacterium]